MYTGHGAAEQVASKFIRSFTVREWAMFVLLCFVGVWTFQVIATWLGWPREPRFSASILISYHPLTAIIATAIAMVGCLLVGSVALGPVRYEAGLFTAASGLAALASRGGTVGAILRTVAQPRLYNTLLFECLMLLGIIALAWLSLPFFARLRSVSRDRSDKSAFIHLFLAGLIQLLVTSLLVLLLARTDGLKQALASVFIAALLGAVAAHQTVPVMSSVPFWCGTILTGVCGFGWAVLHPQNWQLGIPANALANVPPLGYASLGTAGALMGYWISQRWHAAEEDADTFEMPEATPEAEFPE